MLLILGGWAASSDRDKATRWRQTITWAEQHGCVHLIPELRDDEKYGGPEGPDGYSDWVYQFEYTIFDAVEYDDLDFVKTFVDDGGDVNERNEYGESLLYLASLNWLTEGDSNSLDVIKVLIASDTDLKRDGGSVLCHMFNNPEGPNADVKSIISLLIDKGVSIDAESDIGFNALSSEAGSSTPKVLDYILSLGANINYQNKSGMTALMYATIPENTANVRLLLERGADPGITNNDGASASDYAVESDYHDIIELLENSTPQTRND